jgi:hypothetical protein
MAATRHETTHLSDGMNPSTSQTNIVHPIPKIPSSLAQPPPKQDQSHQKRPIEHKAIAQMGEKMAHILPVIPWIFEKEKQLTAHKNAQTTPQNQLTDAVYIHLQTPPVVIHVQKRRNHTQQNKKSVTVKGNPADMKQLGLHGSC